MFKEFLTLFRYSVRHCEALGKSFSNKMSESSYFKFKPNKLKLGMVFVTGQENGYLLNSVQHSEITLQTIV
jgi:hypothetical protein